MYSYFYIQEIELDKSLMMGANKAGIKLAKKAENCLKKFAKQFPIKGELTIRQVEYLVERQAEWAELVTTAYNDILRRRTDKELKASGEWRTNLERFIADTRKALEEMTSAAAKRRLEKTA